MMGDIVKITSRCWVMDISIIILIITIAIATMTMITERNIRVTIAYCI